MNHADALLHVEARCRKILHERGDLAQRDTSQLLLTCSLEVIKYRIMHDNRMMQHFNPLLVSWPGT